MGLNSGLTETEGEGERQGERKKEQEGDRRIRGVGNGKRGGGFSHHGNQMCSFSSLGGSTFDTDQH